MITQKFRLCHPLEFIAPSYTLLSCKLCVVKARITLRVGFSWKDYCCTPYSLWQLGNSLSSR